MKTYKELIEDDKQTKSKNFTSVSNEIDRDMKKLVKTFEKEFKRIKKLAKKIGIDPQEVVDMWDDLVSM